MTIDEIIEANPVMAMIITNHGEGAYKLLVKMMEDYGKQQAVEFFKWNVLKMDSYVHYMTKVHLAEQTQEKIEEANRFEGSTIEERYALYLDFNKF